MLYSCGATPCRRWCLRSGRRVLGCEGGGKRFGAFIAGRTRRAGSDAASTHMLSSCLDTRMRSRLSGTCVCACLVHELCAVAAAAATSVLGRCSTAPPGDDVLPTGDAVGDAHMCAALFTFRKCHGVESQHRDAPREGLQRLWITHLLFSNLCVQPRDRLDHAVVNSVEKCTVWERSSTLLDTPFSLVNTNGIDGPDCSTVLMSAQKSCLSCDRQLF